MKMFPACTNFALLPFFFLLLFSRTATAPPPFPHSRLFLTFYPPLPFLASKFLPAQIFYASDANDLFVCLFLCSLAALSHLILGDINGDK
jgi:hypothetical protein